MYKSFYMKDLFWVLYRGAVQLFWPSGLYLSHARSVLGTGIYSMHLCIFYYTWTIHISLFMTGLLELGDSHFLHSSPPASNHHFFMGLLCFIRQYWKQQWQFVIQMIGRLRGVGVGSYWVAVRTMDCTEGHYGLWGCPHCFIWMLFSPCSVNWFGNICIKFCEVWIQPSHCIFFVLLPIFP